jgi:hypothetical protein
MVTRNTTPAAVNPFCLHGVCPLVQRGAGLFPILKPPQGVRESEKNGSVPIKGKARARKRVQLFAAVAGRPAEP